MKKFIALASLLVCLTGCWDKEQKVVCDAACRAERSGEADFPKLDTSAPESFKKAPEKGQ
ncbi:hypothetical protein BK666_24540 [Pseudomonas frederiksbergensis]|uniref:Uncharacterized protein n=1 Tax=Pseudomonas frederiksbergensis TaxID=104087 RepID=A0A423JUN3_9PSED|nr:hypothetical protein [Pseudomonas frederiksbergensis]RON41377.1 hypothetical protein BK666_24540 [Pseudomonas frederiksbergensis]